MTVQMSAVHDDASFSVASNGEIVVSRAGTKITCTGGTPTRVTTNVISIRNVPMQGGSTTVELVEPSAFAPGASTADELGGDREIEVFVNFSGDLDSRLTLVGWPANENIRAGTSGINPNARIAELAPDTDILLVDVATAVTITGGNGFNVISATGGLGTGDPLTSPIVLVGGDGVDVLTGGNGHDSLYGGAGQDLLHGFGGNDALAPGSGDDDVDGGAGHDAVDYIANPTGVDVDLAIAGPQLGSGADTFAGIEDVYGTRERDVLRGDRGANQLIGFEGDVYAIEDHRGPVTTTSLYEDEFMVNIDRTLAGEMIGIEIVGVTLQDSPSDTSSNGSTANTSSPTPRPTPPDDSSTSPDR